MKNCTHTHVIQQPCVRKKNCQFFSVLSKSIFDVLLLQVKNYFPLFFNSTRERERQTKRESERELKSMSRTNI